MFQYNRYCLIFFNILLQRDQSWRSERKLSRSNTNWIIAFSVIGQKIHMLEIIRIPVYIYFKRIKYTRMTSYISFLFSYSGCTSGLSLLRVRKAIVISSIATWWQALWDLKYCTETGIIFPFQLEKKWVLVVMSPRKQLNLYGDIYDTNQPDCLHSNSEYIEYKYWFICWWTSTLVS